MQGSLCKERAALATLQRPIVPAVDGVGTGKAKDPLSERDRRMLAKGKGGNLASTAKNGKKPLDPRSAETFEVMWEVEPKSSTRQWALVLADCGLEEYPAHPPVIDYNVTFLNNGSHLPAQEDGMITLHVIVLLGMLAGALPLVRGLLAQYKSAEQVHLSAVLLAAAYIFQAVAAFCEAVHIATYSADGLGMRLRHGRLPLDFFGEVAQNLSELLLSSILIAISLGWMLDSNFRKPEKEARGGVGGGGASKYGHGSLEASHEPLPRPSGTPLGAGNVGELISKLTGASRATLVQVFSGSYAVIQFVMELVGRRYEDDFNSFHDEHHWPGFVLMLMRIGLAAALWWGVGNTLSRIGGRGGRGEFLHTLRLVGVTWLLAFPVLVMLIAPWFAPTSQHWIVTAGSLVLQGCALAALTHIFLSSGSEFTRMSSIGGLGTVFGAGAGGSGGGGSAFHDSGEPDYSSGGGGARNTGKGAMSAMAARLRKKVAVD